MTWATRNEGLSFPPFPLFFLISIWESGFLVPGRNLTKLCRAGAGGGKMRREGLSGRVLSEMSTLGSKGQRQGSEGQSKALRAGPQGNALVWVWFLTQPLPGRVTWSLSFLRPTMTGTVATRGTFLLLSQPEPSAQPSFDFLRIITAHKTGILVTTTTIISNHTYLQSYGLQNILQA